MSLIAREHCPGGELSRGILSEGHGHDAVTNASRESDFLALAYYEFYPSPSHLPEDSEYGQRTHYY